MSPLERRSACRRGAGAPALHRQRGVTLLFALLALAVLSLAAVGLARSVNGNAMVLGNLSFKADTAAFSDRGTEAAIGWITAQASLDADNSDAGYYSTSIDTLDPTGNHSTAATRALVDWNFDDCADGGSHSACLTPAPAVTIGSNTYSYIVTRLCAVTGSKDLIGNSCATSVTDVSVSDTNRGDLSQADYERLYAGVTSMPLYRVIVRSTGGRNAVTYTETIVRF